MSLVYKTGKMTDVRRRSVAPCATFLPAMFFICGVRLQKFSSAAVAAAAIVICLSLQRLFLKFFFKGALGPASVYRFSTIFVVIFFMFAGVFSYQVRCKPKISDIQFEVMQDAVLRVEAWQTITRNENYGMFYGYGVIKDGPGEIAGKRVFFSVNSKVCDKIPLNGQIFTLRGDLKFIENWRQSGFLSHLKRSHINLIMNDCCLISCDTSAPRSSIFIKWLFERFVRSIKVGVEDKKDEYGVLIGMLTGYKGEIERANRQMFCDLGIAHLFAVSGLHISTIAITINFFLRIICLQKKHRAVLSVVLLSLYVSAIGASPSSVRALIMVAFYHIASLIGRRPAALSALSNAALFHSIYDPFVAFNISFLLSYSIVAGIVLIGAPLSDILSARFASRCDIKPDAYSLRDRIFLKTKNAFIASLSISSSAYFVSFPLSVDYFESISLLIIPVNMIIVPVATCAIIIGATTLPLGLCNVWWLCAILNNIACFLIKVFRILAKSLYCESCCFRGISMPLLSGNAWTILILIFAYLALTSRNSCAPQSAKREGFLACK